MSADGNTGVRAPGFECRIESAQIDLNQGIGELKLPKEALNYTISQLDETKNGISRVLAKELRDLSGDDVLFSLRYAARIKARPRRLNEAINTSILQIQHRLVWWTRCIPNNGVRTLRRPDPG